MPRLADPLKRSVEDKLSSPVKKIPPISLNILTARSAEEKWRLLSPASSFPSQPPPRLASTTDDRTSHRNGYPEPRRQPAGHCCRLVTAGNDHRTVACAAEELGDKKKSTRFKLWLQPRQRPSGWRVPFWRQSTTILRHSSFGPSQGSDNEEK